MKIPVLKCTTKRPRIRRTNTYFFRIISIPWSGIFSLPPFSSFCFDRSTGRGPSNRTCVSNNQLSIVIDLARGINCFIGVRGHFKIFLLRCCCFTCFKKGLKYDSRLWSEKFRNAFADLDSISGYIFLRVNKPVYVIYNI